MIVAMPLRVKGGHVTVMIVSLRKLPNAEGLHFSAFHLYLEYKIIEKHEGLVSWSMYGSILYIYIGWSRGILEPLQHMIFTTAIELSDLMKSECPTPSYAKANIDHNSFNIKNAWNDQSLLS